MTGLRTPGPQCQVKNWFEDPIDEGTSALVRHQPPHPYCQVKDWFPDTFEAQAKIKSGTYWVTWANAHAQNSTSVDDLVEPFKANASAFIKALEDAGATVSIHTTLRSPKRAYLFHWCWLIGLGKAKPSAATPMAGVDIEWDHGDEAKSQKGAKEMIAGFGLAVPPHSKNAPSLTSNHTPGKAIDMDISWTGAIKIKKKDGTEVSVAFMEDVNQNTDLHAVGASYGVKKLKTDAPHWSHDGH